VSARPFQPVEHRAEGVDAYVMGGIGDVNLPLGLAPPRFGTASRIVMQECRKFSKYVDQAKKPLQAAVGRPR
jgi:hypothetical protein